MTAFNVVRFRVKPEGEDAFLTAHKNAKPEFAGMRRFTLFKTGDQSYCVVGEWDSFSHIAAARPQMIGLLDSFRQHLVDLGAGLGVTDPVSGTVIIDRTKTKKAAAKAKPRTKTKAKKKAVKKSVKKTAKKAVAKKKTKRGRKK